MKFVYLYIIKYVEYFYRIGLNNISQADSMKALL